MSFVYVAFHAALLLCDLAAIVAWRRMPSLFAWLTGCTVIGAVALVLAGGLAQAADWSRLDMFGLYAHAFFGHGLLLAVAGAQTLDRGAWIPGLTALGLVLVGVDAFFVEPRWLEVTEHRIESEKVRERVRIVVLADLQTDDPGEWERSVLARAAELRPDLVLLPGDYVQLREGKDEPTPERLALEAELRALLDESGLLEAPLGVLAVGGNVDPPGWPRIFAGTAVSAYETTRSVSRGAVQVTALDFGDSFDAELVVPPTRDLHVVFGHGPDFALSDQVEADVLIAGHCHGGQVRIPFLGPPIKLSAIPRKWTDGLHEIRPGTWLSVSRGIGVERGYAPPLRFLCRPQLVVIDVVPAGRP